jgi:hypothetical protein
MTNDQERTVGFRTHPLENSNSLPQAQAEWVDPPRKATSRQADNVNPNNRKRLDGGKFQEEK